MIGGRPDPPAPSPGTGPLDGVVVLDLGRIVAGTLCSFLLASLGATVIRIDQPGGDVSWHAPPFVGPEGAVPSGPRPPGSISLSHLKRSQGKRSVVLDLESGEGRALFARLVARADVLVENYRPGTLARLGLEPHAVLEANPRLIYCAISGFGQTGPYRDRLAMDLIVQAASGFLSHNGFPDGPPVKAGATVGDQVPAVYAAFGVLAALRQREQTGRGQLVDVAMFDVMASLVWDEPIEHYDQQGLGVRWGNFDPRGGPLNVYATSDGWLALAIGSNAHWQRLCVLMEREDLATAVTVSDRTARLDELDAAVAAWCATRSTAEISSGLDFSGIPNSPVVEPLDLRDDPQVAARGTLIDLVHPDSPHRPSGYRGAPMPVRLSGYPTPPAPAETLGASTDAVLAELIGLGPDELAGLRSRGVI